MSDCKKEHQNDCYHILSVNGKNHKCQTWENPQSQYDYHIHYTNIIAYPTRKI